MKIKCPACENVLQIDESLSGQVTDCICGKKLRVPQVPDSNPAGPTGAGDPESARQGPAGQADATSESLPQPEHETENVGAGSNAPAQPDALGKNPYAQQQDQLNPYAATSDSFPPDTNTGLAVASLVLGITSIIFAFICCGGFVFAIPAVVCGVMGIKQANRGQASGKGMAIAGVIMGGIVLVLTTIIVLLYGAMLLFGLQNQGF